MIVLKKKHEELQLKYTDLETKHNNLLDENFKFKKIAEGEYGSSIEHLLLKWGELMWRAGVKPLEGSPVIKQIKIDLDNLLIKFMQRKK